MNNRSHHRTWHRLTNHSALARQRKPACRAGGSFRCKECELARSAGLAAFGRGIHTTLSWCFARLTFTNASSFWIPLFSSVTRLATGWRGNWTPLTFCCSQQVRRDFFMYSRCSQTALGETLGRFERPLTAYCLPKVPT